MNQNSYAPPSTAVADVESGVPIERPRHVKIALILCWLSLALALPLIASDLLKGPDPDDHDTPESVFFAIMGFFSVAIISLVIWLIVSIGRARNWARLVYSALTVFGLISTIASFPEFPTTPWFTGPLELLTASMDVAIVVLLFLPESNAWFRVRGRRPASPPV